MKSKFFNKNLLASLIIIIFFIKCAPPELKISKISTDVSSNFLIGKSNTGDGILYTSLLIEKDSLKSNITDLNRNLIFKGYASGNYVNDSVMIVLDSNNRAFLYNILLKTRKEIKIPIITKSFDLNSLKINKMQDKFGLYFNLGDSLVFLDPQFSKLENLVKAKDLAVNYSKILSFDVLGDEVLICVSKPLDENVNLIDYYILNLVSRKPKKIFSTRKKRSFGSEPVVCFVDSENYLTSYYDDKVYLLKNNINKENSVSKWSLGKLEILNMSVDKKSIYLGLYNRIEQGKSDNNFDHRIIEGYNIYTADLN